MNYTKFSEEKEYLTQRRRGAELLYESSDYPSYLFLKTKDEMEEARLENYAPSSACSAPLREEIKKSTTERPYSRESVLSSAAMFSFW